MAELKGTNLSSSIVPFTTDDTFATHLAKFGKGGWRSVADTTERDGITADRREAGMAVYVVSEKKVYTLESDLVTWTELKTGPEEITVEHDDTLQGEGTEESPLGLSDTVKNDIAGKADKADTLAGYGITDAYTKAETDAKLSAVYHAKGSVADYDSLPDGASVGDVYNLLDTGANYVWTESGWDKLSETVDLSGKADKSEIPTKVSQLENDSGYITQASLEGLDLPDQTGNDGKFLMTNGSETSWEKAIKNNATGENYLAVGKDAYTYEEETYGNGVAIGNNAKAWSLGGTVVGAYAEANVKSGVAIGENAKVNNFDATTINDAKGVAVGTDAQSTNAQAISIGGDSVSSGVKSIAIGSSAVAGADGAIQLGEGTNSTADTLQFKDKTIIKGDGTVPYERLSTATPTAGQVLKYDGDSDSLVWGEGGGGSAEYPDQTDNSGKFLMTDGTDVSWEPAIRNNSDDPDYSLCIGKDSENISVYSIAMGNGAKSQRDYDIAIGYKSETFGNASIAIGSVAQCIKDNVWGQVAIGNYSVAGETDSIAIGREAKSTANYSVCLGSKATSNYSYSVAIGHLAQASSYNAVVIGYAANTYHIGGQNQIVIGTQAKTNANNCIAIGYQSTTSAGSTSSLAIGDNSTSGKPYCNAIGYGAKAYGHSSTQIGIGSNYDDYTLKFREYTLVKQDGTIPPERLSSEPPAEGFTLVYDGQAGALRWGKVGGGETAGTEVIIRRWN